MFNNIIYFIVVLLISNSNYSHFSQDDPMLFSLWLSFASWLIFAGICHGGFKKLSRQAGHGQAVKGENLTWLYQRLITRLSIFAIFILALMFYLFNIKYWLHFIPFFESLSILQGISALAIYFTFLSTIWYFAYPVCEIIFRSGITRKSYIISNYRLSLPLLFPWIFLSLIYDIIEISSFGGSDGLFARTEAQIAFFVILLTMLMLFMPGLIQYWWGCEPLPKSEKVNRLNDFLIEQNFKCRNLLRWPLFEGRMLTAGIMGILPGYRYIMISDSLLDILSVDELKAVLAHEIGHAKYRHLIIYLFFLLGYVILSYGLYDFFIVFYLSQPFFANFFSTKDPQAINLSYILMSLPILLSMLIYFRYLMGFFMRNFERQADLYSAAIMGTPEHIINSLEKIAFYSGESRNIPSWHHFGIKERVDYLTGMFKDPGLIKRHNRFIITCLLIYVIVLAGLGYLLNFSAIKERIYYTYLEKTLSQYVLENPQDISLYQNLAIIYQQMNRFEEAIWAYEKIIHLDQSHAIALNNLAWLLVTAPQEFRNPERSLELALQAVALKKTSIFLDTLAEAYYANGRINEAIVSIDMAISIATGNNDYYKKQRKKFLSENN